MYRPPSFSLLFIPSLCGGTASPHQTTWQSQNELTLCSCLYCKSSELGRLGTFLAFVQEQWAGPIRHSLTAPGTPAAWIVHSGKYWNCVVAVKIPELPHMDCGRDGNLLMPEVNHLATL